MELDEFAAASDYPHPPGHIGRLTPTQDQIFINYFGQKMFKFFDEKIYYAGKGEDGQHYFTNQESWYKFKQRK